ncbi:uncharacterized protein EV154DRAFT_514666 [Mucor mucedo]|uniref:uncharacterized protein n=1 Tax=Mucor mucedo TaxID=29922 RepID=UPI00221E4A72|nr:uncharacterized protein EV154DRAFT_514666 [Mucor mucedo]KAI7889440.1 hypothetical protein EV154DRAFT_514666 [Mucor mucedo]
MQEFVTLTQTKANAGWKTTSCLNCNCGEIYSLSDKSGYSRVVIHENAIYGQQIENLKNNTNYSRIFNIKLEDNVENLIPMPSLEDVPEKLVSTHKQIVSMMDQSIEKIRLESKLRIEEFKLQEEKKTQELISHAKVENNQLWSKVIQVADSQVDEKKNHVRFAPVVPDEEEPKKPTKKRLSFALDESAISSSLKNKNLDYYGLNSLKNKQDSESEEEEEDMFNLDEEFSDDDKENEQKDDDDDQVSEEEKEEIEEEKDVDEEASSKSNDLLLSTSLKKSISDIDQKFSWIKKKRNTSKYLTQDFDLKTDLKKDTGTNHSQSEDENLSMFATSVPITIHYPAPDEEEKTADDDKHHSPKRKDILASSFANYDFSYSDRMLSEQFPAPRRRKSLASSSLIRPQLDSLVGKSLDTRGLMKKKANEIEPKDKDEYDSSLPPHVWAAMESTKDEDQ